MIQSDLDLARSEAVVRSRQALALLEDEAEPVVQARALFELCAQHRALAVAALLRDCDAAAWARHLSASGQAQLQLRERAASGVAIPPKYLCGSKNIGLTAALAGGDLETARRLGRLSPEHHDAQYEYEDDFLFFRFLQVAIETSASAGPSLMDLTERWGEVVGDDGSAALDVCLALAAPEENPFEDAFEALLVTRDERLEAYRQMDSCDPKAFATESKIFVEGLAVLRVAELRGIGTLPDHRHAPTIARVPTMDTSPAADTWRLPPS